MVYLLFILLLSAGAGLVKSIFLGQSIEQAIYLANIVLVLILIELASRRK